MVVVVGIEDTVGMETDVLQVLRTASVMLLCGCIARHARSASSTGAVLASLWTTNHVFRVLHDKLVYHAWKSRFMVYELE